MVGVSVVGVTQPEQLSRLAGLLVDEVLALLEPA
jgi:hypothetical protein